MSNEGNAADANKTGESESVENHISHKRRQKESVHHAHFVVPQQQGMVLFRVLLLSSIF